jgi:hypothetical protein
MLILHALKKFYKNAPRKSYKQNKLTNMSKSGKVHISVTFLLVTFFCKFFKNFFNGFEISVKFEAFFRSF